jgi:alpha-methylacyl-CoA racemase
MTKPLKGVTVIELAAIGPAPFAGMMLADMGADIVRVDRLPAGRGGARDARIRSDSVVNRGRRSIALNLKEPDAVEIVLRLVEKADILIEGFRPGVTEKCGVGPQACHQRNPRLVYGRMTGWGQTGPLAQAAGHDINYIALSGALHAMGSRDKPPMPPLNLVGDYGGGGMLLALGVLAALLDARQSGCGQVVDAAMTEGSAALMAAFYGWRAQGQWLDQRESNFLDGGAHFYGTYECADGAYVAIGAIEPQFYRELLQLCGVEDPAFEQQWAAADWPGLRQKLADVFRSRTRAAWCALLEGTDACFAPVLTMEEAPQHPHNVARGTFVERDGVMQPAPAPRFGDTPGTLPPAAPAAGEHSSELLQLARYDAAEIQSLIERDVVFQSGRQ